MKPTIEHIHKQIETLRHPMTNEPIRVDEDITSLHYEDNKLVIRFAFSKGRHAADRTFQRALVQILKQELGIPHIVLDYKPQETKPVFPTQTKMERSFPNASFIVLMDETGHTTQLELLTYAARYVSPGQRGAIIDLDFIDDTLSQTLELAQTDIDSSDNKVQPFNTADGYEFISPHLFTSHGRAMAWRTELQATFVDQALHGVRWHEATDVFFLSLPKHQLELLPLIKKFIPQVKIEVITRERK